MNVKKIPLSEINAEGRFRQDFGDMEELCEDIKKVGLLQPITVLKTDSGYRLLAGGRRLKAHELLKAETIEAIIRTGDDNLTVREIELMENVARKDFTWQERIALETEIFTIRKAVGKTQAAVAEELDVTAGNLSRRLELGRAMEMFPVLAKAKNEAAAHKMLAKLQEKALYKQLTAKHEEDVNDLLEDDEDTQVNPLVSLGYKSYHVGDSLAGLKKFDAHTFHWAEVDPPYGINLLQQRRSDGTDEGIAYIEVDGEKYEAFLREYATEVYRVLKMDSFCLWWFGHDWHAATQDALEEAGFFISPIPGIWTKTRGQTQQPQTHLASCWEPFWIARKGSPHIVNEGRSNVFAFSGVSSHKKIHPTERPIALMQEILKTFATPGSRGIIPFLGSGVTLRAAFAENMLGEGFDLAEENKGAFLLALQDMADRGAEDPTEGEDNTDSESE